MEKKIKIEIPSTPNFIRMKNSTAGTVPLKDFTTQELEEIGKEWTKNLIEKSHRPAVDL